MLRLFVCLAVFFLCANYSQSLCRHSRTGEVKWFAERNCPPRYNEINNSIKGSYLKRGSLTKSKFHIPWFTEVPYIEFFGGVLENNLEDDKYYLIQSFDKSYSAHELANVAYILGAGPFCKIVYIALNLQNAAGQGNSRSFELIAPEFPDNPLDPEGPDTKSQIVFTGPTTSKGAAFKFSHFTRAVILKHTKTGNPPATKATWSVLCIKN